MSDDKTISRRTLLKSGAALTFVVMLDLGCKQKVKEAKPTPAETAFKSQGRSERVGAWVVIRDDESVMIYNPAAEMGQGSMTALPLIVAEEMDADWEKVQIENSPVEPSIYGRSGGYGGGSMMTVGSRSVMGYFTQLRLAGAQIRAALIEMAAKELGVDADELSTETGTIVHVKSKRRMTYGELAALGNVPEDLPRVSDADLKSPKDFRLIGTSVPRHDVPAKTNGSAEYSIDVQFDGLLYGMIERAPIHDGKPKSYNEEEVRGVDGVVTTVKLDHGIGLIADSVEAVMAGRRALKVEWEDGPAKGFDSEKALLDYPKALTSVKPQVMHEEGKADKALKSAAQRYEIDYFADFVYHAQMEPLNAVAWVKENGEAEVWLGTQGPGVAKSAVAAELGIDVDKVTMNRCYLGGGFGRRSNSDYVVEAVQLSAAVKKPVKHIWTREDDIAWGRFRPQCLHRMTAGIDKDGRITAWKVGLVGDGGRLLGSGIDVPYYDIPNQKLDLYRVDHGLRLHYWRAVGHHYNKFAIEAFIDEIADAQDIDPVQFRRQMLSEPRAKACLERVVKLSDWPAAPEGRAKGVCVIERSGTHGAAVAEVSVDRDTGKIRVHKFWAVLDGGIIVQPDNALAQIEGSIVMGLSAALVERVTIKDGVVVQSNYSDYRIMPMSESPEIVVEFVGSEAAPSGIGEPGIPLTAAAVANAFGTLTGKRLRHMPFTPDRVRAVL